MPDPLCHRTSLRPAIVLRLRLVVAALLACAVAGPARAQTGTNPNPGGSSIVGFANNDSLTFAAPVQTMTTINASVTEIIARLNGGTRLYDLSIAGSFGSPAVQAAIAAADAALLGAGGLATTLLAPALLSQAIVSTSTTVSTFALDPSTPLPSSRTDASSYTTISSITTFGPATVFAAVSGPVGFNPPNAGIYSLCNVETLPSATRPTCTAVDGGTLFVLAGQTAVTLSLVHNYLIDTATTVTTTDTQTQVYEVDGTRAGVPVGVPEPAGWPLVVFGLAATGLFVRRRDPRG